MRGLSAMSLAPAATITATGFGDAVDIGNFSGWAKLVLDASATSAEGVTLGVKLQHSANGVDGWTDPGIAFETVDDTAASQQTIGVNVDRFHRYVRVVDTVAGDSPSVVRAVLLFAKADR